jgi:hypothetical protein
VGRVLSCVVSIHQSWSPMTIRTLAILLCLPALMGAEIYRYVDANGVVNYVQQLPYGVQGERIQTADGVATVTNSGVPEPAKPATDPKLDAQQQAMLDQLQKAEQARREEIARIRQANCTRSRDVLERLSVAGRIRVNDPDGQQRVMPEEERQERIAEAQKGIVTNCGADPSTDTDKQPPPAVAATGG